MRVLIELTDEQARQLEREAIINGFKRVDPRKRWSESERKEAIRYAIDGRLPA